MSQPTIGETRVYRELDEDEKKAIAQIQWAAEQLNRAMNDIEMQLGVDVSIEKRWWDAGKLNIQTGLMQVLRGITRPGAF